MPQGEKSWSSRRSLTDVAPPIENHLDDDVVRNPFVEEDDAGEFNDDEGTFAAIVPR